MMLLAVETASPDVSVALHDGARVIGSIELGIGSRHAEAILPAVQHLAGQCGVTLTELTHLAVDRGPGLFTGLRVGLATVRALAFTLAVPVIGVNSLEAIAVADARDGETVVALLDARRKEVYAAAYRSEPGQLVEVVAPFVAAPQAVRDRLIAVDLGGAVLLGDGQRSGDGLLLDLGHPGPEHRPHAGAVAKLAARSVLAGQALLDPFELLYLRAPDAEITWENRHGPAAR
jgi:tRNA threonylcarbamoyladenosine biosynthesis protein TsaB